MRFLVPTVPGQAGAARVELVADPFPEDLWAHVAVTAAFDGQDTLALLYVDGAEVDRVQISGALTNPQPGARWVTGNGEDRQQGLRLYIGEIDDLRLYDRALTPNEITVLSRF